MTTWRRICDVNYEADRLGRVAIRNRPAPAWVGWLLRIMPLHEARAMVRAVDRTLEAIEAEEAEPAAGAPSEQETRSA